METKKSIKADLEKKRGIFFQIGFIIVLGLCLLAFEWEGGNETDVASLGTLDIVVEEEIIPITRQEEIKTPPPPQAVVEELNIVEDNEEIDEEVEIKDAEADQETQVEQVEINMNAEEEDNEVYQFVLIEDKPTFPGGETALIKWLVQNTKFPPIAKDNGVSGKVYVGFVIDKTGKVTDVKIVRSVDPYLDQEALRVVKSMPDWTPGKQRGKPVKVSYQVPINFKLQ